MAVFVYMQHAVLLVKSERNYSDIENLFLFYLSQKRKTIPKDAKLHLNEKVLLKLKFTKLKVLCSSLQSLEKMAFFSILLHGSNDICNRLLYIYTRYLNKRNT